MIDELKLRRYEMYNPHKKKPEELPVIYGFNNGGSPGFMHAQLLAEDGTAMGSHLCSDEYYMYSDLGIIKNSREDRHKGFRKHYPNGYRMDFVTAKEIEEDNFPGLKRAIELNRRKREERESKEALNSSVTIK